MVIKLDSKNLKLIRSVIQIVSKINAECFNLGEHQLEVQEAALSTHKLSEEESTSKTIDLITGFHLIDPQCHLFVLEGLREFGIRSLYEKISKSENGCQVIYNSSMGFSQRLYSSLDLDLLKIKLFEPLDQIVKKPLLYIRDMTPKTSFEALIKINQLIQENKLRDITRCELLPAADMILSLSKEFGVPLTEKETKLYKISEAIQFEPTKQSVQKENLNPTNEKLYNSLDNVNTVMPHTSRIWTPIDNNNDNYFNLKKDRENRNFLNENKIKIGEISEKNQFKRPIKRYIMADTAFNYSSQSLNSTELALNKFREIINQNDSNTLYSYCRDYHNSSTFVPVNLKKEEKESLEKTKSLWKTTEGWIYPDIKTSLQSNEHSKKLDQASIDRINEPWEENFLHANKLISPLDRNFFKGNLRSKDFDVWTKPQSENIFSTSIFEAGDTKEKLIKEENKIEIEKWNSKLIVDCPVVKVHKLSGATEMKISGPKSNNQIDKLTGLLKSEPKKRTLLYRGVNFNKIPALSVIKTEYKNKDNILNSKGFVVGNDEKLRITDDRNQIPVHYYDRSKFINLRGKDFDLYGTTRSPIYKRSIEFINFDKDNTYLKSEIFILPNKSDFDTVEKLTFPKAQ